MSITVTAQLVSLARREALEEAERICEEVGVKFGTQEMTAVCAAGICATRIRKLLDEQH